MIVIQEYGIIDGLTSDNEPLHRLPYPLRVNADGTVRYHVQPDVDAVPCRIIGFTRDLAAARLDYAWHEVVTTPAKCVGMYVVSSDRTGRWFTHSTAVESAVRED